MGKSEGLRRFTGFIEKVLYQKGLFHIVSVKITEHENELKVGNSITCLGTIPFNVAVGYEVNMEGTPDYDKERKQHQLKIVKCTEPKMGFNTFKRVCDSIKGIGPVKALKIYKSIPGKNKVIEIIKKNIRFKSVLSEEQNIELISKLKRALKFTSQLDKIKQIEGLTDNQIRKIQSFFDSNMDVDDLKSCIYSLSEEKGFGFKRVDDIAIKIGVKLDDEYRIESCILYTIKTINSFGSTIIDGMELAKECRSTLRIEFEKIKKVFDRLVENETIIRIGEKVNYETELITNMLYRFKFENMEAIRSNKKKNLGSSDG